MPDPDKFKRMEEYFSSRGISREKFSELCELLKEIDDKKPITKEETLEAQKRAEEALDQVWEQNWDRHR